MKEFLQTQIGWLAVETSNNILKKIDFVENVEIDQINFFQKPSAPFTQLQQYFAKEREKFNLEIDFSSGTLWQQKVWREMIEIPYGITITYGDMAERLGDKKMARAVASACGANPIPIVVPCHRVVAKEGLGGYSGGLKIKKWLLKYEGGVVK